MRPTLKTIAGIARVSPATVSLCLNRHPVARTLSEETRNRIWAAARECNYRPNYIAKALSRGRTSSIGLVVADLKIVRQANFASEIMTLAAERGNHLLIASTHFSKTKELEAFLSPPRSGRWTGSSSSSTPSPPTRRSTGNACANSFRSSNSAGTSGCLSSCPTAAGRWSRRFFCSGIPAQGESAESSPRSFWKDTAPLSRRRAGSTEWISNWSRPTPAASPTATATAPGPRRRP